MAGPGASPPSKPYRASGLVPSLREVVRFMYQRPYRASNPAAFSFCTTPAPTFRATVASSPGRANPRTMAPGVSRPEHPAVDRVSRPRTLGMRPRSSPYRAGLLVECSAFVPAR